MLPYPLINFAIQKQYQNEPNFNGVYSRNNLANIKDRTFVINLDEFKSMRAHWIALYMNGNNIIYFDSFGVEHIPKEIKEFIRNKNIITNIYSLQACDSIMCEHFCIRFNDFTFKSKSILDDANLFFPNDDEKSDSIIKNSFCEQVFKNLG